jgi:hypothetical protein
LILSSFGVFFVQFASVNYDYDNNKTSLRPPSENPVLADLGISRGPPNFSWLPLAHPYFRKQPSWLVYLGIFINFSILNFWQSSRYTKTGFFIGLGLWKGYDGVWLIPLDWPSLVKSIRTRSPGSVPTKQNNMTDVIPLLFFRQETPLLRLLYFNASHCDNDSKFLRHAQLVLRRSTARLNSMISSPSATGTRP